LNLKNSIALIYIKHSSSLLMIHLNDLIDAIQ
jgi:hypothetical protein